MTATAENLRRVGIELMPGDEAEAVIAAAEDAQAIEVERNAAVVIVTAERRLTIDPAAVRAHLGQEDWKGEHIQIIMASYFGFITKMDDEGIVLEWLAESGG